MIMQEGSRALGEEAATRQRQDRAHFLDLLGDSLGGLGRHEAAVEAYRQAAQELQTAGASCSYALCLLKTADNYLSLREPWNAIGYLQACLPLLRELGLVRHFMPRAGPAGRLSGRADAGTVTWGGGLRKHQRRPPRGKFDICPIPTDSPTG